MAAQEANISVSVKMPSFCQPGEGELADVGLLQGAVKAVLHEDGLLSIQDAEDGTPGHGEVISVTELEQRDELSSCVESKDAVKSVAFLTPYQLPSICLQYFGGFRNLESIDGLYLVDANCVQDACGMFSCPHLKELDVSKLKMPHLKNASEMLVDCASLKEADLSGYDVSEVEHAGSMFAFCIPLEALDLSNLSTRSAKDISVMFAFCSNLRVLDVSGFEDQAPDDFSAMLLKTTSLEELNGPEWVKEMSAKTSNEDRETER